MDTGFCINGKPIKVNDLVRMCTGQVAFVFYHRTYETYSIKYYNEEAKKVVISTLESVLEFNVITEILGRNK